MIGTIPIRWKGGFDAKHRSLCGLGVEQLRKIEQQEQLAQICRELLRLRRLYDAAVADLPL